MARVGCDLLVLLLVLLHVPLSARCSVIRSEAGQLHGSDGKIIPFDGASQGDKASFLALGNCHRGAKLLHQENLTVEKDDTTMIAGVIEIHADGRYAVTCGQVLPKTVPSRTALLGYRLLGTHGIAIHFQEAHGQLSPTNLDYQILVYGTMRTTKNNTGSRLGGELEGNMAA
ncbi:uncharacterized protein LOC131213773 [Anopheles bellator]|uniref:uncharacterized protein LOC131213773 n=1 Tax=Anopheles bellator TaxID=139047 RepID=UPI002648F664|nr:uncharacterized protein LOC131213773 [Anopheles bellator]